jgi:hypothetical protein
MRAMRAPRSDASATIGCERHDGMPAMHAMYAMRYAQLRDARSGANANSGDGAVLVEATEAFCGAGCKRASRALFRTRRFDESPSGLGAAQRDSVDAPMAVAAFSSRAGTGRPEIRRKFGAAKPSGRVFARPPRLVAGFAVVEARAGVANAIALGSLAVATIEVRSVIRRLARVAGCRFIGGAGAWLLPRAGALRELPLPGDARHQRAAMEVR